MNHGAISVIYLALSAVCLIGLYGVYKPQINTAAGNTFDKVERFTNQGFAGIKGNGNHANNPAKPNN